MFVRSFDFLKPGPAASGRSAGYDCPARVRSMAGGWTRRIPAVLTGR